MSFITIPSTWIAAGKVLKQSLFQYIKDNFDSHETALSQLVSDVIPNGSFENVDGSGYPLSWAWSGYTGGTRGSETTAPAHGARGIWITSPGGSGNGGGYYDSDYVNCSPYRAKCGDWFHKASVAGIHDLVEIRWYDKAKSYLSSSTLYDSAANPTSWIREIAFAVPPANAVYCKARLTGAKSDNTTAGTAYFDGFSLRDVGMEIPLTWSIAECSTPSGTYVDIATLTFRIPFGASKIVLLGLMKGSAGNYDYYTRLAIGSTYSNEVHQNNTSVYAAVTHIIDVTALQGTKVTLAVQGKCNGFTVYYKGDAAGDNDKYFVG